LRKVITIGKTALPKPKEFDGLMNYWWGTEFKSRKAKANTNVYLLSFYIPVTLN